MRRTILVFVGGYGVPASGMPDGNITRYIQGIIDDLPHRIAQWDRVTVVFLGGATNPNLPEVTEAQVLSRAWLDLVPAFHLTEDMSITVSEKGLDLRDNLVAFRRIAADRNVQHRNLIFYCEAHRHRRVAYLVGRIFRRTKPIVHTIDFDERVYTWRDRLARWAEYWSAVASQRIPYFYRLVERPRRMRKIGRDPKTELPTLR